MILFLLTQPTPYALRKFSEVLQLLQIAIHDILVDGHIVVDQDVSEAGNRR